MSDLIQVHYHITCAPGESIERVSREIAVEQTVEVPEECITPSLDAEVVGKVLALDSLAANRFRVVIGFPAEITANAVPQFLNILFGNISLKDNIQIRDVDFPGDFLGRFRGPRFGIAGLRRRLGVYGRPLACTALKPLGSRPDALAALAGAFALAGGDLIKDDHGLADHSFCPFRERVARCQEAIRRANRQTGRKTLYFPNVIGDPAAMEDQIRFAMEQGVEGILLSPFLVGPDLLRYFAGRYPLATMAHPAFTGTCFHDGDHGILPSVLLGKIFRLLGADISVFPNSGGRFCFSAEECRRLAEVLTAPLGNLPAAFPAPAGGMRLDTIDRMAEQYGEDAVFLIGGSLLKHSPDLRQSTAVFMDTLRRRYAERLEKPE